MTSSEWATKISVGYNSWFTEAAELIDASGFVATGDKFRLLLQAQMLQGMGLECLLKGCLLAQTAEEFRAALHYDKVWGHDLKQLWQAVKGLPDMNDGIEDDLEILTDAILFAGRYPTARASFVRKMEGKTITPPLDGFEAHARAANLNSLRTLEPALRLAARHWDIWQDEAERLIRLVDGLPRFKVVLPPTP